MNKLTLIELRLQNFKGITNLIITPDGKDINAYGANETGKTTLADSIPWLFWGLDSKGKKDFGIKPTNPDGSEKHNLDTEVEGTFIHGDDRFVLMKRFHEVYTKKRGSAKEAHTGHTDDYFIDGVPIPKKKDYDDFIQNIMSHDTFKLITSPFAFHELDHKKRRDIVLKMCGDIDDKTVIESSRDLKGLDLILGKNTTDQHKAITDSKVKAINKELAKIPIQITEQKLLNVDIEKPSPGKIKELDKKILSLQTDLSKIRSNELVSEKRIRINVIDGEIQNLKNDAVGKENKLKKPLHDEIRKLESDLRKLDSGMDKLLHKTKTEKERNKTVETALVQMRAEYAKIRDEKQVVVDTCYACGENLKPDNIQKTIDSFNVNKAERLEKNQTVGKEMKQAFDNRGICINEYECEINSLHEKITFLQMTITDNKEALENTVEVEYVNTDHLIKEKSELNAQIKGLLEGSKELENECKEELQPFLDELDELNKQQLSFDASIKSRERIKELDEQEKELSSKHELLQKEIYMIEQFIVIKVEMLEDKINSKFKLAKFKMFNRQINGGIDPCCEAMHKGVLYNHGLNNGARVNVGRDIINTLSVFYGLGAPLVIDNAESINEIIPMDTQLITLSVSDDKELLIK